MRRIALIASLVVLPLAACGEGRTTASTSTEIDGQVQAALDAVDPWCRPTPNGRDVTACYLTLTSSVDDRLTTVISPRAAEVQIHEVSTEGGVMRMQEMPEGLPLTAGQTVSLAPGGDHLMLIGVTVPLVEGDRVPLALTFDSGAQIAFEAVVRTAPVEGVEAGPAH